MTRVEKNNILQVNECSENHILHCLDAFSSINSTLKYWIKLDN